MLLHNYKQLSAPYYCACLLLLRSGALLTESNSIYSLDFSCIAHVNIPVSSPSPCMSVTANRLLRAGVSPLAWGTGVGVVYALLLSSLLLPAGTAAVSPASCSAENGECEGGLRGFFEEEVLPPDSAAADAPPLQYTLHLAQQLAQSISQHAWQVGERAALIPYNGPLNLSFVAQLTADSILRLNTLPNLVRVGCHVSDAEAIQGAEEKKSPAGQGHGTKGGIALKGADEENALQWTVVGDTHGQLFDVLNLFELNGWPSSSNPYIFNGDFVDRGAWGLEVLVLLLYLQNAFPSHVVLLRGNHESRDMTHFFGFQGEVFHKLNRDMYEQFLTLFDALPIGAVLADSYFVAHGGLFHQDGVRLAQLDALERRVGRAPFAGLMQDLLWSDPVERPGRTPNRRGAGVYWGPDVSQEFLTLNNLKGMIRSHQVVSKGVRLMHHGLVYTVFSAPRYVDQMDNLGGYLRIRCDGSHVEQYTFQAVEHPPLDPMPYVAIF
eukprot:g11404.t1